MCRIDNGRRGWLVYIRNAAKRDSFSRGLENTYKGLKQLAVSSLVSGKEGLENTYKGLKR